MYIFHVFQGAFVLIAYAVLRCPFVNQANSGYEDGLDKQTQGKYNPHQWVYFELRRNAFKCLNIATL